MRDSKLIRRLCAVAVVMLMLALVLCASICDLPNELGLSDRDGSSEPLAAADARVSGRATIDPGAPDARGAGGCERIEAAKSWYSEGGAFICSSNEDGYIALTFDDGPHPVYTDRILDVLDRYGVKATFFVIGTNCAAYPEQLKRIAESGHEIGNHTYTHLSLAGANEATLMGELRRTEQLVQDTVGIRPVLFRPPEGRYSDAVRDASGAMGYHTVIWSLDTEDWRGVSAGRICDSVVKKVKSGDIILCHDYVSPRSHTAEALESFIPRLLSDGYRFMTVSELIEL